MKKLLALAVVLALAPVATTSAAPRPSITIASATVSAGVVTVKVKISGWPLRPGRVGKAKRAGAGGHWHLFVDGRYVAFSATATGRTPALAAGPHRIVAALARDDHTLPKPAVRSRAVSVTIATKAPAPEPAPPPGGGGGDYDYGY